MYTSRAHRCEEIDGSLTHAVHHRSFMVVQPRATAARPSSSAVAHRSAPLALRAQSAPPIGRGKAAAMPPSPANRRHTPAPKPLLGTLTPTMQQLISEIVVKPAPPQARLRPTQGTRPGAPSAAGSHARPASTMPAAAVAAAAGGAPPPPSPGQVPRRFGSTAPVDGSRFPKGGPPDFERLSPDEMRDRLDGTGGTTLPSAEALHAIYQQAAAERAAAKVERMEASRREVESKREAAAQAAATNVPLSQRAFAWGSERIAEALLTKFDQFTARQEVRARARAGGAAALARSPPSLHGRLRAAVLPRGGVGRSSLLAPIRFADAVPH